MKPYDRSEHPHERDALKRIYEAFDSETREGALQLYCNVELVDPSTGRLLECDLIVVSATYLAIVELKHYAGHIEVGDYDWLLNGRPVPSPHRTNNHKTKVLKSLLSKLQPTVRQWPFIYSAVVVTQEDAVVEGGVTPPGDQRLGTQTFSSLREFIAHLRAMLRADGLHLDARTLSSIESGLRRIEEAPKQFAHQVPFYEVLQELRSTPLATEYLAYPKNPLDRSLKRLRVFGTLSSNPEEAAKQRRNLDLVAKLPPHPHVARAQVVNAGNLLVEESAWSETGTLRSQLKGGRALQPEDAAALGRQIFEALEHVHRYGVVHRDLTPENILIIGGTAQLMNFDRAYDPGAEYTVLDAEELARRSPYRPEDFAAGRASDKTDIYAAGMILYEMFVGYKPVSSWQALIPSGGRLPEVAVAKLAGVPPEIKALIWDCVALNANDRPSAAGALERLGARPASVPLSDNAEIAVGERYDTREIEAFLGRGASAQVYRARNVNEPVVLKIFNVESLPELRDHERAINRRVSSPAVVKLRTSFQWRDGRHGFEFEDEGGRSVKDAISANERPTKERFLTAARAWLGGLADLHEDHVPPDERRTIVHNDLNPGNLLLGDRGAFIIDLGSASEPGIGPFCGIPMYVAPELNLGGELNRSIAGDLFTLAVSMFEWVTGRHPFGDKMPGAMAPNVDALDGWANEYRDYFARALSATPELRFATATVMREGLEASVLQMASSEQPEVEKVIPQVERPEETKVESVSRDCPSRAFVGYLNSLHSVSANNENALAESQALSPYFGRIHVPVDGVTDALYEVLESATDHVVVLSGHAGDGKSTIALDLFRRLQGLDPHLPLEHPLKAIEPIEVNGRSITIVKDLSELAAPKRLEVFQAAFAQPGSWLIIANTGPLLTTCRELAFQRGVTTGDVENELLRVLEAPLHGGVMKDHHLSLFEKPMVVANLTRYDNVPLAGNVLKRMIASEVWASCDGCPGRLRCPISLNVQALRECDEAILRTQLIYRRLTDYDRRLTARQLTAHLAYSLTGGLECAEVLAEHADVSQFVARHMFADQFFGYRGSTPAPLSSELNVIRQLQPLEFGARPSRAVDAAWLSPQALLELSFTPGVLDVVVARIADGVSDEGRSRERQSLRRQAYFFAQANLQGFRAEFLCSPRLLELEEWIAKPLTRQERKKLRNRTLGVVLEEFTGFSATQYSQKNDDLYITLRRGDLRFPQMVQLVLAELSYEDFDFIIEPQERRALLRYESKSNEMVEIGLALPLLDYIAYRQRGEVGEALDPIFRGRLDVFKSELLQAHRSAEEEPCEDVVKIIQATVTGALRICEAEFRDGKLHVEYVG